MQEKAPEDTSFQAPAPIPPKAKGIPGPRYPYKPKTIHPTRHALVIKALLRRSVAQP